MTENINLALVYAEFEVIPTMQERQPDWTVLFLNAFYIEYLPLHAVKEN